MKKKIFIPFVIVYLLLASFSRDALSDGMYFRYASEAGEYVDYDSQRAIFLINEDESYSLFIQTNCKGNPSGFSWVLPLPGLPVEYGEAQQSFFDEIDTFTAPRFFKEESCTIYTCSNWQYADALSESPGTGSRLVDSGVTVWTSEKIGLLETSIISGESSAPVINWLYQHGFTFPEEAVDIFDYYIKSGFYFFVATIDLQEIASNEEVVNLSPLRFDFPPGTPVLYPMRLTSLSEVVELPITIYVIDLWNRVWAPSTYSHVINTSEGMSIDEYERYMDDLFVSLDHRALFVQYFGCIDEWCYSNYSYGCYHEGCVYIEGRHTSSEEYGQSTMFQQLISREEPIKTAVRYHGRFTPEAMDEDIIFTRQYDDDEFHDSVNDFIERCDGYDYVDTCLDDGTFGPTAAGCSIAGVIF